MVNSRITEDAKFERVVSRGDEDEEDEDDDTGCGFGGWRPQWLQNYATIKLFTINFCIVGILQGAFFTYMIGILSTVEKRFAFESKVGGFILIADNLSQMCISPLAGYLGTKINRAYLIGTFQLIVAFACLGTAFPFYWYGPAVHLLNKEFANSTSSSYDLCQTAVPESCGIDDHTGTAWLAVVILWMASFANGFGYSAFYTVGLPFIDDNVKKKNAAMYLSTISTLRLLGPCLGFVLSSICLSFYENPLMDPGIDNKDPRWVGAWWLGFVILWFSITAASLPMFLFPQQFKELKSKVATQSTLPSFSSQELKDSFRRLSTNYLLIFHVFGGVFRIIGYFGYYVIKPKYIELQYRMSASSAAFYTGAASVVTMAIGTMLGGIFIRYKKPRARYIALMICLLELFSSIGIFSAMFLQCETPQFSSRFPAEITSCNAGCSCSTKVFQPVCDSNSRINYFSPCFAGCTKYDQRLSKFTDCSCVPTNAGSHQLSWASDGLCPRDCNKFPIFISILSLCNLIASTARTGDTLLTLRSVDPRDKSLAMGVVGMILALFAFIPNPMIFGYIIDTTCLVWEKSCGSTGNCWLYDMDRFRVYFHSAAVTFLLIGISLEFGVVAMAGRVRNLYDEDEDEAGEKKTANGIGEHTEMKARVEHTTRDEA